MSFNERALKCYQSVDLKNMEDEENVNLLMENIMIVLRWIYWQKNLRKAT